MNAKEAREIVAQSDNGHGLDGLEMAAFNTAKGFLDCYEQAKPLVAEIENAIDYAYRHPDNAFLPFQSLKQVLSQWRKAMGEE